MKVHDNKTNLLLKIILLLALFTSTACDPLKVTSQAYQLGRETGAGWRDLSKEINEISSWATEPGESPIKITEVDKLGACRAMWLLVGWPQFGLEKMSKNRTDFIDGCMTTIGN